MRRKSYETKSGTVLPLLDLRGKEYLEVKYRLVWFREEHPSWAIETEYVSITEKSALAKAIIRDEQGRLISTGHKFENMQGFSDFLEKAETGAVGRALALIGYGTQFCADELDEGKRIVDSPVGREGVSKSLRNAALGEPNLKPAPGYIIERGKWKGYRIPQVPVAELKKTDEYFDSNPPKDDVEQKYHSLIKEYLSCHEPEEVCRIEAKISS